MITVAGIEPGSIAEELRLEPGTRIVRINGEHVRDGIDFEFLGADPYIELETVTPDGREIVYEIERDPSTRLGVVPEPDKVRECANECVFCFIDGNPEDVRESLWLRDDDFRLSFTYGNYVTLTNVGPGGIDRLIEQRISPLYVSVHATEPELRARLLQNDRAGEIMDQLRRLLDAGLEVHTQVVLCPEWNDGPHLDRTIRDLRSLGEGVLSLSVVPVGLTRYNLHRPVRLLTAGEAGKALEQVDRARERSRRERGFGWCYAADELFLIADEPIPDAPYYDDWPLTENGVGALRRFLDDFDAGLPEVPRLDGRRIHVMTGRSMAPFIRERAPRLAAATGAGVRVVEVENGVFGETVTVAGLLPGESLIDAAPRTGEGDLVLLPAKALNGDDLFIDSVPLDEVAAALAPARVATGTELTATLEAL